MRIMKVSASTLYVVPGIHYSATNDTNNPVNKTNMLLLDSGVQYL